jgi:hypothetical protein
MVPPPRRAGLVVVSLAHSCGSADESRGPLADAAAPILDAGSPEVANDSAVDATAPDVARSGVPGPADLQGAWYVQSRGADARAGDHARLLIRGADYYETASGLASYCTEVGAVDATAAGDVRFTPRQFVGFGCSTRAARAGTASWTDTGIELDFPGETVRFARARDVPKIFVTVESHDGNLAGDATVPGANAIEKADALCNQSAAKPDDQQYAALLVDGIHRSGVPAVEWVLKPDTTYYQADGVLNVFRTTADGLSKSEANNPVLSDLDGWYRYSWTGLSIGFVTSHLTCGGWASSNATDVGAVGDAVQAQFTFGYNVSVPCHDTATLVCVSR